MEYRHSWVVHLIAWLSMLFWGGADVAVLLTRGREEMIWPILLAFLLAIITAWLYFREGLLRWRVEEVHGPFRVQLVRWGDIDSVKWLGKFRAIQIKGKTGVLCFMSPTPYPT